MRLLARKTGHEAAARPLTDSRGIVKDQDAYILDGFNIYFLWLRDPEGISNYLAQGQAIP